MFGKRIYHLGKVLETRLESHLIQGALDYISFNEEHLAFEIWCDHISEYDIELTAGEYDEICELARAMKLDINEAPFKYLKELVL